MIPDSDGPTSSRPGLTATAALVTAAAGLFGYALVVAGDRLAIDLTRVGLSILILGTATVLIVSSGRLFRLLDERGTVTAHQREVSYRLAQLLVVVVAFVVVVLGVWNVSLQNAILGAGVTSVVVALAARQTLSSIIAGVIIIKDFDDSQVTLAVKMWVDEPRPMAINAAQTTVLAALHKRFGDEDITIPFPQRTVSDREMP